MADLSGALERERRARAVVERDLAVLNAVQPSHGLAASEKARDPRQQALWPQDGETSGPNADKGDAGHRGNQSAHG
jgi:hypothetical protein